MGGGGIADAGRSHSPGEVGDRLGRRRRHECGHHETCRTAPILTLEHVTGRHCRQCRVGGQTRAEYFFDRADFFHQLFSFAVLPELQIRILHEIVGMRVHRVDAVEVMPCCVVLAGRDRFHIRGDRFAPHAEHGKRMRGHVQRMGRRRRQLGVALCRRQALTANWRKIIAVDDVVRDTGMVRLLRLDRLQDRRRLELFGVGLVIEIHRFIERKRVEDGRLGVVGITLGQLGHRRLIGERARAQVHFVVILEEGRKRLDPVLFALGLGAGRAPCLDRLPSLAHQLGRKRGNQRIGTLTDGYAPVGHGTRGLLLGQGGECLHCFRKEKRMQHRNGAIELALGGGAA